MLFRKGNFTETAPIQQLAANIGHPTHAVTILRVGKLDLDIFTELSGISEYQKTIGKGGKAGGVGRCGRGSAGSIGGRR